MGEILGNAVGQWGAFPHASRRSNTTPAGGNPREMGNEILKFIYAFKFAPGFEEGKNEL